MSGRGEACPSQKGQARGRYRGRGRRKFTHTKTGKYHQQKGGDGRGFRGRKPKTFDSPAALVDVGEKANKDYESGQAAEISGLQTNTSTDKSSKCEFSKSEDVLTVEKDYECDPFAAIINKSSGSTECVSVFLEQGDTQENFSVIKGSNYSPLQFHDYTQPLQSPGLIEEVCAQQFISADGDPHIDKPVSITNLSISEPNVSSPVSDNLDKLISEVIECLQKDLPKNWIAVHRDNEIQVMLLSHSKNVAIQRTISVSISGDFQIKVHRKDVPQDMFDNLVKKSAPALPLSSTSVQQFSDRIVSIVSEVRQFEICSGVPNTEYKHLWKTTPGGHVDNNPYDERRYDETFRSNECSLLVQPRCWRCAKCNQHADNLRKKYLNHKTEDYKPNTPNIHLTEEQKLQKLKDLHTVKRNMDRLFLFRRVVQ